MAQATLAQQRPIYEAPKVRRKATRAPRLFYPTDAIPLRSPFRDSVLHAIYESAQEELGDALKSVVVSTWQSYDEDDSPILLLTFWTDADNTERMRADRVLTGLVSQMFDSWSEGERKEYSETIYFGVEPIDA